MHAFYFSRNFFEDLFCHRGRFGCTNRFTMSKKKSEKESKEKKQSAKKVPVKALPAAEISGEAGVVALKEAKPKAKKAKEAPGKKPIKAVVISGEDIALRAYFIAERRSKMGWHGDSTGDWVEAERQLKAEAAKKK